MTPGDAVDADAGVDPEGPEGVGEPPQRIGLPRFLTIAIVAFAAIMVAWRWTGDAYDVAFREAANLLCAVGGVEGVRFEDNIAHRDGIARAQGRNVVVSIKTGESATQTHYWGTSISTRHLGYLPTAIFLALLSATPISRKRRFKALLYGGLLLYGFIAMRVAILVAYEGNNQSDAVSSERWSTILHHLHGLLNMEPMIYSLAPALIWVAVSIRREDLPRFLPARPA